MRVRVPVRGQENPLTKDYGNDLDGMIKDLLTIGYEVIEFLESRYGPVFRPANLICLLHLITIITIKTLRCPLWLYEMGLESLYVYLREKEECSEA